MPGTHRLAEIGDFLAALRSGGVPVGPGEIDRLCHLFARAPHLERAELKTLLAALLAKTPAQQQTFDALFAAWCPDRAADWPPATAEAGEAGQDQAPRTSAIPPASRAPHTPQQDGAAPGGEQSAFAPPPPTPPAVGKRAIGWLLAGALLLALILADRFSPVQPPAVSAPAPAQWVSSQPATAQADPQLPDQPVREVWAWYIDDLKPADIRAPKKLGALPLALLGGFALALALGIWWHYRRRFPHIVPQTLAHRGFDWQPLPPPARDDDARLDARARRQLVWNIGRFVAEEPTRRLDLPPTVERTARAGGYVRFSYQPAVFERAIWFWFDRYLASPTAREIAAQLAATLRAAGLDARLGWFAEAPQRVDWPAQPGYRPLAEEGPGRQAQVVIFTDGAGLRRRIEQPLAREDTLRLLRALQHWPRLCFVDCSPDGEQLAALFAAHALQLDVVRLPALAAWLGGSFGGSLAGAPPAPLFGATRQWAAVVALGGGQADAASAHTLRAMLGLAADAWEVDRVLQAAAGAEQGCRLLNWLLRSEPLDANDLPAADSVARRALDWWRQRYAEADAEKRAQENPLLPWQNSLAQQRWQVEDALLQLYTDPVGAADRLSALAGDELRAEIGQRLRAFTAADHPPPDADSDAQRIQLTWRFRKQRPPTQRRLRALGFAGDLYQEQPPPLRHARRLVFALTLLSTLALVAFAVATQRWLTSDTPRLLLADSLQEHPAFVAQTLRLFARSTGQQYQVTLGNARETVTLDQVAPGAAIPVNWRWAARANPVQLAAGAGVLLRAGSLAQPMRACSQGWPQRSLAIIDAPYADSAARQLAIRLLDKGSADQVLIEPDWRAAELARWLGAGEALQRETQLLVIVRQGADSAPGAALLAAHAGPAAMVGAHDFAAVARALDFAGTKPIAEAGLPWRLIDTRGAVSIAGGPQVQRENGIDWVSICPGSFTMGSRPGEAMAQEDEVVDPPRVVTLSAFRIAASETTNAQYASLVAKHALRDERPVVDVNWQQARSFCQQIGGDLPSEAQWEYAARGGSQTPWSFGSDEKELEAHAWFGRDWKFGVQPVRQKRPNPLGLSDMHGNAWEWTRDGYAPYASGHFIDPEQAEDDAKQGRRVLRGGSFDDSPAALRSAVRVHGQPEDWVWFLGFRCVRVPPQP